MQKKNNIMDYKVGDEIEVLMPHYYIQWEEKYPLKDVSSWIYGIIIEVGENSIIYSLPDIGVDRMMAFKSDLNCIRPYKP